MLAVIIAIDNTESVSKMECAIKSIDTKGMNKSLLMAKFIVNQLDKSVD